MNALLGKMIAIPLVLSTLIFTFVAGAAESEGSFDYERVPTVAIESGIRAVYLHGNEQIAYVSAASPRSPIGHFPFFYRENQNAPFRQIVGDLHHINLQNMQGTNEEAKLTVGQNMTYLRIQLGNGITKRFLANLDGSGHFLVNQSEIEAPFYRLPESYKEIHATFKSRNSDKYVVIASTRYSAHSHDDMHLIFIEGGKVTRNEQVRSSSGFRMEYTSLGLKDRTRFEVKDDFSNKHLFDTNEAYLTIPNSEISQAPFVLISNSAVTNILSQEQAFSSFANLQPMRIDGVARSLGVPCRKLIDGAQDVAR